MAQYPAVRWPTHLRIRAHHVCCAHLLGIVVALFFQCMATLLNPANPIRKRIRWALVAHTVTLFLFLTIPYGIDFDYLSTEYINNREFPGDDEFLPGPIGYDNFLGLKATTIVFDAMFPLNQWLADGLLVSLILNSGASVYNVARSSSYIGVISFIQ